ncbi:Carbapenem-hydrolyzing beta-lactamase blaB-5 precursor [sediment metagenome]|uniref:Carbapenem-hydrolyzing beta-lactamase blaB-5 n=1 Tax=sediment metagenome TaxID=749907 RepID=D9PF38_9ZZZZ
MTLNFSLSAQQEKINIEPVKLAENIYVFKGTMSNSVLLAGAEGSLLIDSCDKGEVAALLDKTILRVTEYPVKYLINTHWHFDHVGGNEYFGANGVTIIGQDEMRKRAVTQPGMQGQSPLQKAGLPVITYKNEMTMYLDGEEIYLFHPANQNVHTDGDTVIYFKKSNIIHMGDLYFEGLYPYLDLEAGGWINGMIAANQDILKMLNDKTIVIPGHGPVTDMKKLEAYIAMLSDISAKVTKMITEGKTLEEVKALKPTEIYDEGWGKIFLKPDQFVELVYKGLKKNLKG